MAELVDALVSNTSGFTSMPVRSRLWVLQTLGNQLIVKGFLFIWRTKSVLPDEKKKKEYFRRFSNLLCFINKDAAYFFLSLAFVCFENGIHHLSL